MKKEWITTKCPACGGTGEINVIPKREFDMASKTRAAMVLKDSGFSIRQIMKLMGYKSPAAVQNLLNK